MTEPTQFTAAEAAYLLRVPLRVIKKALDNGPARPIARHASKSPIRLIDWAELFYLFAARALRDDLTPKARTDFHAALQRAGTARPDEIRFGRFRVSVADLVDELTKRTNELAELHHQVAFTNTGEAILETRGIKVHRIAALLRGGLSVDALREEYPALSHAAIETARAYAQTHPKPGRPVPEPQRTA